jgi:hypothetical protein
MELADIKGVAQRSTLSSWIQGVAEEEINGSVRVIESSLAGPKGVILQGQIKSLILRRADIVYGYKVMKDRPPREWIGSSELTSCGTY